MTIWWCPTGPKISYKNKILQVEDLNPEQKIAWRMSRLEMLQVGLGFIAAVFTRQPDPFNPPSAGPELSHE